MDLLAAPLGFAALLVLLGLPIAVAARVFRAKSTAVATSQALIFSAAMQVALATGLGAFGLFLLWPMLLTTITLCSLIWWLGRGPRARLRLVSWPSRWPERALFVAALGVGVLVLAKALVRPPLEWDSITYHLTRAAHWVREGSLALVPLPDAMDNYNHFPWNGEVLAATLMLASHDDTWVGLLNVPFAVLLAAALLALGKEFGARPRDRRIVALLVCTAPVVLAQAHTAHVELQIAAEIAAAALFAVRALRGAGRSDVLFAALALGLAIGTKLTALVPAALLAVLLSWHVLRRKELRVRGGLAVIVIAVLAAPRYLMNLRDTGNPLYPIPLRLMGLDLAGSPFDERALGAKLAVSGSDLEAWLSLLPWRPGAATAVGFGPQLLLLVPLCLLFAWTVRRQRGRGIAWGILLAWLLPFAGYFASQAGPAVRLRRGFATDTPRYLASLLPLIAATAFGGLASLRSRLLRSGTRILGGGLMLGNLAAYDRGLMQPAVELGCGAVALAALVALGLRPLWIRGVILLLAGAGAIGLRGLRAEVRYDYWSWQEQHIAGSLPPLAAVWKRCDESVPRTVAYAVGREAGKGYWFSYPLFGSRLQNRIAFVVPDRVGSYDPHHDAGRLTDTADYQAWRANLHAERADLVLLQYPLGPEHELVRRHAEEFELLAAGSTHALLRPK